MKLKKLKKFSKAAYKSYIELLHESGPGVDHEIKLINGELFLKTDDGYGGSWWDQWNPQINDWVEVAADVMYDGLL